MQHFLFFVFILIAVCFDQRFQRIPLTHKITLHSMQAITPQM
jgi:hypothetical protein